MISFIKIGPLTAAFISIALASALVVGAFFGSGRRCDVCDRCFVEIKHELTQNFWRRIGQSDAVVDDFHHVAAIAACRAL